MVLAEGQRKRSMLDRFFPKRFLWEVEFGKVENSGNFNSCKHCNPGIHGGNVAPPIYQLASLTRVSWEITSQIPQEHILGYWYCACMCMSVYIMFMLMQSCYKNMIQIWKLFWSYEDNICNNTQMLQSCLCFHVFFSMIIKGWLAMNNPELQKILQYNFSNSISLAFLIIL